MCYSSFFNHLFSLATWSNRNESHNPRQSVDELIIKDQKMIEVEMEIRRQVDNLMREELDLLKAVSIDLFLMSSSKFKFRPLRETRERRERSAKSARKGRKAVKRERRRRTRI